MKEIKLNLGCASRPLQNYVNIDLSSSGELKKRYPNIEIPHDIEIYQYDIFNLPYADGSVDEVRSDSLLEHLSFKEEKLFFYEIKRVLKINGTLIFSVPDFEKMVEDWLVASDDWQDFYRDDQEAIQKNHWFGTYSYGFENRWGYLLASIFGPQNSDGQFHKNAYTEKKIIKILKKIDFKIVKIENYLWKSNRNKMIYVEAIKNE
jgi:predicted SAM-dependent methyltransferase